MTNLPISGLGITPRAKDIFNLADKAKDDLISTFLDFESRATFLIINKYNNCYFFNSNES